MIIRNLNVMAVTFFPPKAYSPLVVDANAVLAGTGSGYAARIDAACQQSKNISLPTMSSCIFRHMNVERQYVNFSSSSRRFTLTEPSSPRTGRDNLSNLSPHPLHVGLSYSHPPIHQRIRSIEDIPAAASLSIDSAGRQVSAWAEHKPACKIKSSF
jgi:hypothetical protein